MVGEIIFGADHTRIICLDVGVEPLQRSHSDRKEDNAHRVDLDGSLWLPITHSHSYSHIDAHVDTQVNVVVDVDVDLIFFLS